VRSIDDLLAAVPALSGLAPGHRELVAGCTRNRVYGPGEELMREGGPADEFFVVRSGTVAIETMVPGRGGVTIETLHDGDIVGWSWLVAPYRAAFGARSLGTTHALAIDGACLRGKCETDPALGYDLLKLIASVFTRRLAETRLRLLDLYGTVDAAG
jgi:CRP/FNR family transcriptional regulator, cyclic AMP receptor protein